MKAVDNVICSHTKKCSHNDQQVIEFPVSAEYCNYL